MIFEEKLKEGEPKHIANKYAKLEGLKKLSKEQAEKEISLLEEKKRICSFREFEENKDGFEDDIYKYAELKLSRNLDDMVADRAANIYEKLIYDDEKSTKYADKYVDLVTFNGFKDELADECAQEYEKKLEEGHSVDYANKYVEFKALERFRLDGLTNQKADEGARIFEGKLKEGKTFDYASKYAREVVLFNRSEEEADKEAKMFESRQRFNNCKGSILEPFNVNGSHKRKFDERRELNCAEDYSKLVAELQAKADETRKMSEIFNGKLKLGRSSTYASEYARLIIVCKEKEEDAREMSEIFEKSIKAGMNPEFARRQAESIVKGVINEPDQKIAKH